MLVFWVVTPCGIYVLKISRSVDTIKFYWVISRANAELSISDTDTVYASIIRVDSDVGNVSQH
jgi:hypothetical protein